jgi:hypothetical protein
VTKLFSTPNESRLQHLLRRPWRDVELPLEVLQVPAMISDSERRLLYSLGREYAQGEGAIVDAGCFLGGSSVALLAGVRDRAEPWEGPPVASYDLFRVEDYALPAFFDDEPGIRVGDSFRRRYDANVAGFGVPHVVHEGDIVKIGWSGGEIDVLFLDVLKSWKINDAILRDFFPHLVPGRSVVIHQDYGWGGTPWIPMSVELMGDSFRFVDGLEGGSHVFFLEREVPEWLIEEGMLGLDVDNQLELLDRAILHRGGWVRGMLELARTGVLAERDGAEAARSDLRRIEKTYSDCPSVLICLAYVRDVLETGRAAGGVAHGRRMASSRHTG